MPADTIQRDRIDVQNIWTESQTIQESTAIPLFIVDQLGAGKVVSFRSSGVVLFEIDDDGPIQVKTTLQLNSNAIILDIVGNGGARIQDGGVETIHLRDSSNVRGINIILTAAGDQTISPSAGNMILTGVSLGAASMSGTLDMANNIITNIGAAGTDFTATGGLTLADQLVLPITAIGTPALTFTGFTADTGIQRNNNVMGFQYGGALVAGIYASGMQLGSGVTLGWGAGNPNGDVDIWFSRSAASALLLTNDAVAGGATTLTITQAAHTAVIAEQPALVLSTTSITLTDTTTIARYGWAVINAPTFVGVAGGGAEVITEAASLIITGAPIQGADITLTNPSAILLLAAGAICFDSRANGGVRMYDGGAEVLNFFDSTNVRGITFTLTAAGNQTIGASAGSLALTGTSIIVPAGTAADPGLVVGASMGLFVRSAGTALGISTGGTQVFDIRQGLANLGINDLAWASSPAAATDILLARTSAGALTLSTAAQAGGATTLTITQSAHTAVVAEVINLNISAYSLILADTTTIALMRNVVFGAPTYVGVAAGGAEAVTTAINCEIALPVQGADLTITNAPVSLRMLGNAIIGNMLPPAAGPTNTLWIANGTAPTSSPANSVAFFSTDESEGHTIPSFATEGTNVDQATGDVVAARLIRVRINGNIRTLMASS